MNLLKIITIGFLILEATNVITLYFFPGSKYANGVGVFKAWEKSKADPEIHNFVKYLVNWVGGTKLIFIFLLVVILFTADDQTLFFTSIALVFSIASFFWRLFPLISEDGSKRSNRSQELLGSFRLDDNSIYPYVFSTHCHLYCKIKIVRFRYPNTSEG